MTKHFDYCNAPICQEVDAPEAIWYPGEDVCGKKPFEKFQMVQKKINKVGGRGWFTKGSLEALKYVRNGVKGKEWRGS